MKWKKVIRYTTEIKIGRYVYPVVCESDIDDGFAVYVRNEFIADVDALPCEEELRRTIKEYIEIEGHIKTGLAQSGAFS